MVATISIRSVLKGFLKRSRMSLQNTTMTAMSVPRCIIILMRVIVPSPMSNPSTRCNARGLNESGDPGNEVECELILWVPADTAASGAAGAEEPAATSARWAACVWRRGTVPVWWRAEAKEMGMHFFIYSGGEPLVRKKDIITLCEKHDDCVFMAFTNGTLIDEEFADDMLRVKNFVPAISVEGFGKATDFRRGNGTYDKVCRAMDILKAHKLPFGVSCCYTKENTEVIGSEEYFDWMIGKGAYFAWFFTYMPIGNDSPSSLMVTASQRAFMYERIRGFRKTKLLFTMDFWNDGEFVGGCIAGGRYYMHINANGDIEPCAFIHYSDSNVKEKSLLEALKSPLFTAYRKNQPFNCNHLRPCPLLDNPDALAKVVDESGAASTDMMSPEDVHELCGKCHEKAEAWAPVADELWKRSHA